MTLGGVDVTGWGSVLGYIFKSSINSGVIAMVRRSKRKVIILITFLDVF